MCVTLIQSPILHDLPHIVTEVPPALAVHTRPYRPYQRLDKYTLERFGDVRCKSHR